MEKINELPNPADFMKLGEDAFIKNVHEKLRETLSTTEKQMWINGYLLALTQQKNSYSVEDLKEAFKQSRQAYIFEKDMPPIYESFEDWFEQFKNK